MRQRAWPDILLAAALALVNGVGFPLWTGYSGGATNPLPLGLAGSVPYLIIAVANVAALLGLHARSGAHGLRARDVLLLAALTRSAYFVCRAAQGATTVDPDVELYFRYGGEFAASRYPEME